MDEASPLDPDFMMALCAIIGVATASDRAARNTDRLPGASARIMLLIVMAAIAIDYATSVRGFLYCLLMPVGAYKVAQVVAEPLWQRRADRRAARLRRE